MSKNRIFILVVYYSLHTIYNFISLSFFFGCSNNSVASSVQGDFSENPLASSNVLENLQPPECNISSEGNVSSTTDSDSKSELLKHDLQLPPEVPQNLTALNGPSYNLGFLPPMVGSQVLQVEGHDNLTHEAPRVSNFVSFLTKSIKLFIS